MSSKTPLSLRAGLWELYQLLPERRRRQFVWLLGLMSLSALSEVVALGSALPFLSALSNAQGLLERSWLHPIFNLLGITTVSQAVIAVGVAFALTVVLSNTLRLINLRTQQYFAAAVTSDLSQKVYHRILHQPYSFHVSHTTSELIGIVSQDVGNVGGLLSYTLLLCVNSLVVIAIALALVTLDPIVTILAVAFLGMVYLLLLRISKRQLTRNSRQVSDLSRLLVKYLQEGLGGIREILLDGSQHVFEARYCQVDRPLRRASVSTALIGLSPRYVVEAVSMSFIACLATVMVYQADNLDRIIPVLGTLALGANRLLPALQGCFVCLTSLRGNEVSLQRVIKALQRPITIQASIQSSQILPLRDSLVLENIWFSYESKADRDWILNNLSLSIEANQTVAFVGSTGSGKSTTADIILGLLKPQHGEIKVDGISLKGEQLQHWQRSISHVPQSIFLADGSVTENIAFGVASEDIDLVRVYEAAKLSQIDKFIASLPAGYDTYVGERGIRLSGGQRQRIGIARALYKRASMIVFDEATSALDNLTEREVMSAIHDLNHQVTVILIAHRLTTVEKCDRIFELHQGKIIAEGTFEELVNTSPSFRQLAEN